MSIKQEKSRLKELVDDDRWKMKGGKHVYKVPEPNVCHYCLGTGKAKFNIDGTLQLDICPVCEGVGEVWE